MWVSHTGFDWSKVQMNEWVFIIWVDNILNVFDDIKYCSNWKGFSLILFEALNIWIFKIS
jgi:hypothetical protein